MAENLYRAAKDGIACIMALQSIRKVIRDSETNDVAKLNIIMSIVHDYEDDKERAELEAERRAIEADEAQMRREKIDEMFENMKPDFDKLTLREAKKNGKE
ncbi:MAG: hypothetical protein J6P40_10230 [Oscillospiraceae bacterium]|nr:hypothetical protein [Oscillospiraceae bacterium]